MVHLLLSVLGWAEYSARPSRLGRTPSDDTSPLAVSLARDAGQGSLPRFSRGPVACQTARASGHELQQGVVDLLGVGPGDGVRAAGDDHRLHVADQAGQPCARLGEGQNLVVIALD